MLPSSLIYIGLINILLLLLLLFTQLEIVTVLTLYNNNNNNNTSTTTASTTNSNYNNSTYYKSISAMPSVFITGKVASLSLDFPLFDPLSLSYSLVLGSPLWHLRSGSLCDESYMIDGSHSSEDLIGLFMASIKISHLG